MVYNIIMSCSTHERLPSDTAENQLSSDLLRDFYQSFRLAQFEADIQPPLFTRLAHLHEAAGNTAQLPEALKHADSAVDKMMPPTRHALTNAKTRSDKEAGFRAMWTEYTSILLDPLQGSDRPDEYVLDDMLIMDEHYQDKTRPNRNGESDPHESIVREYILGDKLKGSKQLLQVRLNLKDALLSPSKQDGKHMTERLQVVIAKWEDKHPGQSFMLR